MAATGAGRKPATPLVTKDVAKAVDKFLKSLTLDEIGEARAALARALAERLDFAKASTSVGSLMAVAGIARQLEEVLGKLASAAGDHEDFVKTIFAGANGS